jgi:hypothetical protein
VAQSEIHTELTAGYSPVPGLTFSLGYRGAYGETGVLPGHGLATHMGFLGMTTSFQGEVPFSRN